MTLGQRIIEIATGELGVREEPPGSNRGPVEKYQEGWGLGTGWPWCGGFVAWVWRQAGVDTDLAHPATAVMCQRAEAQGRLGPPRPGAAIIWCGTHTGVVTHVGDGVVHTIEGNSGDMVTRRVRATTAARFIIPPGLDAEPPKPAAYWLEDPAAQPRLVGPWRRERTRDRNLTRLNPAVRATATPVTTGTGRYGIRIGPRRRYGPWATALARDGAQAVLEGRLGRRLRPYRTGIAVAGAAEDLGKTT